MDDKALKINLEEINRKIPLVPHTNTARLFSAVRRMKAEKEMEIPVKYRSGFAVSTARKKHANEMNDSEWEEFYNELCEELKRTYPELYQQLFGK